MATYEGRRAGTTDHGLQPGRPQTAIPGKRTLVEQLGEPVVQRRAESEDVDPASVHAAASRGVASPPSTLPHHETIQRLFGRHDITGVQAHTGPEAAASARAMGAEAYATGHHVVLGPRADLHTVAHEAAHVVQQRGGVQLKAGIGEVGDVHERHADAVADRVVRGESAEALLDQHAGGGAGPADAVQLLRLTVKRTDSQEHQRAITAAIEAQNAAIRDLARLHVHGDTAQVTGSFGSVEVHQRPASDQKSLEDHIRRSYQSEDHNYEIEMVSHPDLDPRQTGVDPAAIGRARVQGPFAVKKKTNRTEQGDMGRSSRVDARWALNPDYEFQMPGAGPSPRMPSDKLPPVLGLDPAAHIDQAPDRGAYVAQPVAVSSPVIYYVPRQALDGGGFHFTAPMTPASFERAFDGRADLDDPGWQAHGGLSRRPAETRKQAGREPNTEMGGPAWQLNPHGRPPPSRGKLASHEWCHLLGDGDNGPCAPDNLVIGTNQVNTEQLAMEQGLREMRKPFRELGHNIWIHASALGEPVSGHQGESVLQAREIRYQVWLQPVNGMSRTDVVEHIMKADRDFISLREFETLRRLIEVKLTVLLIKMRPQQMGQFEPAPWAFAPEDHEDLGIPGAGSSGAFAFGVPSGHAGAGGATPAPAAPMDVDRDPEGFAIPPAPRRF